MHAIFPIRLLYDHGQMKTNCSGSLHPIYTKFFNCRNMPNIFTFFLELFFGNFSRQCGHPRVSPRRHNGGSQLTQRTFKHHAKTAQVKPNPFTSMAKSQRKHKEFQLPGKLIPLLTICNNIVISTLDLRRLHVDGHLEMSCPCST